MQSSAAWVDCGDAFVEVLQSEHFDVNKVHHHGLYIGLHGRPADSLEGCLPRYRVH
jgi:hypothetical protein